MKVLLACSDRSYHQWWGCKWVGRLLTPPLQTHRHLSTWVAMDNFAYAKWDATKFVQMLMRYSTVSDQVKWVACPDVVGDWQATNSRFEEWHPKIQRLGYKTAYVLQDGQPNELIPWEDIAGIFVGGTDLYKESPEALDACKQAKSRGKLVHIGRVNSIRRVEHYLEVADSIDGLSYSKYPRAHLPKLIKYLEEVNYDGNGQRAKEAEDYTEEV